LRTKALLRSVGIMTRIAPSAVFADVSVVDLGQGDRINLGVAAILSRLDKVAEALGALNGALRSTGTLPPRLLELVRLRIAFHNQCRSCMSVRYQSAIAVGIGRLTATWDVSDDLPEAFQSDTDGPLVPWASAGVVASG
jgi:AhpD family alkylhydroperoxidase